MLLDIKLNQCIVFYDHADNDSDTTTNTNNNNNKTVNLCSN